MSESLTTFLLHFSEGSLLASGILLVIGIFGEYRLPFWHHRLHIFEALVLVGCAGELIADGGVFLFSEHLQTVQQLRVKSLGKLADEADGKAQKAIGDAKSASDIAGSANAKADAAKTEAEAVSKEAVELSQQLTKQDLRAHRFDDKRALEKFRATLEAFPGQPFDIRYCPGSDNEITFLSLRLMGAMIGGSRSWTMRDFRPSLGCSPGMGLVIDKQAPESTRNAAAALQRALFDIVLMPSPDKKFIGTLERREPKPGETLLETSSPDAILLLIGAHP